MMAAWGEGGQLEQLPVQPAVLQNTCNCEIL